MKFLTYLILFYLVYRYFLKPFLPKGTQEEIPNIKNSKKAPDQKDNLGEYIDYEEVD